MTSNFPVPSSSSLPTSPACFISLTILVVSSVKSLMGNLKHLFECIYCNPLKVMSQYAALEGVFDLAPHTPQLKFLDIVGVFTDNLAYYLLLYVQLSSGEPSNALDRRS
jgi:hypothetical protein